MRIGHVLEDIGEGSAHAGHQHRPEVRVVLQAYDDLDARRDLLLDQHSLEALVAHGVVRARPHVAELAPELARAFHAESDRAALGLVEHAVR
jgi:N-acetyl-anhydromuramyl-L-alanine amidase AmpD